MDEIMDAYDRALKLFGQPVLPDRTCASCCFYPPYDPREEPTAMCMVHAKIVAATYTCSRWDDTPF